MTLDELEARFSGQYKNTVQYLTELDSGQEKGRAAAGKTRRGV